MKRIFSFAVITIVVLASGCAKYTDIVPKGQNLLNKASDLDLLMNIDYTGPFYNHYRQTMLINDNTLDAENVPATISGVQSLKKILLTYDEAADRAAYTPGDAQFEGQYGIISKVANVILDRADEATGDAQLIKQLKAEAYVLRAFLHYRLVNIYAKAYDPVTAATDGGIPYAIDINFEEVNAKKTVKEVYDNLLNDINAAIALDALPNLPKNYMRIGKGFAYGVKAQILLSMRDYIGALEAVGEALKYNDVLEDHRPLMLIASRSERVFGRVGLTAPDNVFYANSSFNDPLFIPITPEAMAVYETGNIFKDHTDTYNAAIGESLVGLPNHSAFFNLTYQPNSVGMTVSDLVLIKAECLIRTNKIAEGMTEVENIRIRRINPAQYVAKMATTEAQAMGYLQQTSRTEFLFSIRNFINIKRWNRESKYPLTINRTISGKTYTLQPNSKLYVFPFPQSATQFNGTLTQNY